MLTSVEQDRLYQGSHQDMVRSHQIILFIMIPEQVMITRQGMVRTVSQDHHQ